MNPFSLGERKVMKMPSNKEMEHLDFKSNLILKTKFDTLVSVPGAYDGINFWRSLPCKTFLKLRKFAQVYVCRFETTYTYK